MATIAKFITEMGIDPAGVRAGLDRAERMINDFTRRVNSATGSASKSSVSSIDKWIDRVLALGAAYTVLRGIMAGVRFNRTVEDATLGIASLITAQSQLRDSNGRLLSGTDALGMAQGFAADQVRKLRIAGLQTVATTEELVVAFQSAIGTGLRWGLSLDEIRKVTIGIVQAAGALGVPMNQLNEEVRDLIAGNISIRNTRVATALGITNEDIRRAREAGQLAQFLTTRLEAFNVAGQAASMTMTGVLSNTVEALQLFAGEAVKPLFDSVRDSLNAALGTVFDLKTASISDKFTGILTVARDIFGKLGTIASDGLAGAVAAAQTFSGYLTDSRETIEWVIKDLGHVGEAFVGLLGDVAQLVGLTLRAGLALRPLQFGLLFAGTAIGAIHDALRVVLVILGYIGSSVITALVLPLLGFLKIVARVAGVFNDDLGKSIDDVAESGKAMLKGMWDGLFKYIDVVGEAGSATKKFWKDFTTPPSIDTIVGLPGGDIAGSLLEGGTMTSGKAGKETADAVEDLEKLTTRLLAFYRVADKSGPVMKAFASKVAEAMTTASRLLASEADKMSDNALRLAEVLGKLRDAFLDAAPLPSLTTGIPTRAPSLPPLSTGQLLRGGSSITGTLRPPDVGKGADVNTLRLKIALDAVADTASSAARGLGAIVASGFVALVKNVVSQLSPFALIAKSLGDAMKPLEPALTMIANIVGATLGPIFEALAPVIVALIPVFRAVLEVLTPIIVALLPIFQSLVPILEALFPLFKFLAIVLTYVIQVAAEVGAMLLRFAGNVIIVIGSIFLALAKAIDALPGVSAKGAIGVAEGLIGIGKGMLGAADAFKKTADGMDDVRKQINAVELHTVDGLEKLGDAADSVAASLLNVPTWYKIALTRYNATQPIGSTPPVLPPYTRPIGPRLYPPVTPTPTTGTPPGGDGDGGSPPVYFTGPVYVDARSASASEIFDHVIAEGGRRARAQLGDGATWSDAR